MNNVIFSLNCVTLPKKMPGNFVELHTSHIIKANVRFEMIATIIKSGYEGILI